MVVNCEQVWQEISNYLEGDLDPALRAAMEEHIRGCKRCASVLEGTRNVIHLYGDELMVRTPVGFSWRLRAKLAANMPCSRGTAYGWLVAVAAMGLIAGSLAVASSGSRTRAALRSEHAQPGRGIPSGLVVLVAAHSRVFHVAGCPFIHDQEGGLRSMKASEAVREGYVPCVRCLGKYVAHVAQALVRGHAWVTALL
jgi:anti-sigma factor RsiW